MYGTVISLILTAIMIFITILAAHHRNICTFYCKKSEIKKLLSDVPDDCTIQILIGRKYYEHKRTRNH